MMGDKVLASSGRVKVRRFRRRDQKERLAWPPYVDPLLTHLNYRLSSFIDRERWLLARLANAGRMYFAIEDENGALIGEMSLREIDSSARTSRLGIHLASNKRGLGYGLEALTALLEYYFRDMRFKIMYLDVAAHNMQALRLYERLHFRHIGEFWRLEGNNLPIFTDERYAGIRQYFRKRKGFTECMFHDMALTRDEYFKGLGAPQQARA